MKFNLENDLVFFDLEATGLNVLRDRIVQIAMIKFSKDGSDPIEKSMLINPGIPISEEAIEVHGITPDMIRNKPTFNQVSKEIYDFIGDADLAGYNSNRFDVPMLMEEFARAGYDFDMDNRRSIDVQRIFYKMEPRTLVAAYRYYCNKDLIDAHDALADVRATVEVLKGQIKTYEGATYTDQDNNEIENPVCNDMEALNTFTNDARILDATHRLKYNHEGKVVFNFGKYINQPVGELLSKDRQYYRWMLEKEFSTQVKNIIRKLVKEHEQTQKNVGQ